MTTAKRDIEREQTRTRQLLTRLDAVQATLRRISAQARTYDRTSPEHVGLPEVEQTELRRQLEWGGDYVQQAAHVLKLHLFELGELEPTPDNEHKTDGHE